MSMEININCDLGEKSKHHSNKYDPDLLEIVNSANVACGYHAGDEQTMNQVVKISKKNGVSIGAHPSFNDPENFGRERMNLSESEIKKLIIDQYEILQKIASSHGESVSHVKPHGALNNMACEDIELATILAKTIKDINKDIIYLVPTGSKMQEAAKKLDMKFACEIFADRNYEDDGNLVSRKKPHALITDPELAKKHVLKMVQTQSLNCHSGKQIPCEIDSVCIHGDNLSSLETAKSIRDNLVENGLISRSRYDNYIQLLEEYKIVKYYLMKAVIQRVTYSNLSIDNKIYSQIKSGLVVLLGITHDDDDNDVQWLAKKIVNLRIFNDDKNIMNKSLIDVSGELMIVSQFTLHAQTKKGNRPSYIDAANGDIAEKIYKSFVLEIENKYNLKPKTGKFGADMKVELENDGPVTIIIDTKNK